MRLPQQHVKSIVGFLLHSSLLLLSFIETSAQQVVFTAGEKGYASFRIPAIVKAPNGDLLAIGEGRVRHAGDFGNIDLVLVNKKRIGVLYERNNYREIVFKTTRMRRGFTPRLP